MARDGRIGALKDVCRRWAVRYLVVDTGERLSGRRVLISPALVLSDDAESGAIVHARRATKRDRAAPRAMKSAAAADCSEAIDSVRRAVRATPDARHDQRSPRRS
jgi:hypothetical protein